MACRPFGRKKRKLGNKIEQRNGTQKNDKNIDSSIICSILNSIVHMQPHYSIILVLLRHSQHHRQLAKLKDAFLIPNSCGSLSIGHRQHSISAVRAPQTHQKTVVKQAHS